MTQTSEHAIVQEYRQGRLPRVHRSLRADACRHR